MTAPASSLPEDWTKILDDVHIRLDQAVAATDSRIAQLPHWDLPACVGAKQQEITRWNDRLKRLSAFLESAEQIVHSVDEVLQREETQLRQQMTVAATLRQKLGGAIG
jgi:hypothetical protein